MKAKHLKSNSVMVAGLVLSIFFSASPLWAMPGQCGSVHRSIADLAVAQLQVTLAKVPLDNYGLTAEKWKSFQSSVDSVFQTHQQTHEFLWKFSQTLQRLKGVASANPSQAAMQALREGRPMPDQLRPFRDIESAVLSFLVRLPQQSPPPDVLIRNYRALVLLVGEATPHELENLKGVLAGKIPENASDPVWSAKFTQALEAIQNRLGHRILQ